MKKALYIVISILVIVLSAGIYLGVSVINSPEYALMRIANDIQESGVNGLMTHLTDEAQEMVSAITSITENKTVNSILSLLCKDDYVSILKSNLKDVEWSFDDVLEGTDRADVVLGFNYNEKLIGTIEINMIKEDGDWKINGISYPIFDKVDLN